MTAWQTLQYYFAFPFVRYALIVGVLIALCASLFGVTLVLKRFSFIGDGLSHVAFGALAIAAVLNLTDEMLLVLPVIGWAVYVLMTVVEHFPSLWNTGVQITVENRARVYRLLGHLLSTLKCLTTAMFAGLTLWCVLARPLPGWFLPVVLVVLFGDMIFWLVRVIRAR